MQLVKFWPSTKEEFILLYDKILSLKQIAQFKNFSTELLSEVAENITEKHLNKGEIININRHDFNIIIKGKGLVTGGELSAKYSISANVVGSKFGTITTLKINKESGLEEKIADLRNKLKENFAALTSIKSKIKLDK